MEAPKRKVFHRARYFVALVFIFSYLFRFVGRCTIFFVAALLKIGRRPNNAVPTNQYSFHFIHFEVLFVWLIR